MSSLGFLQMIDIAQVFARGCILITYETTDTHYLQREWINTYVCVGQVNDKLKINLTIPGIFEKRYQHFERWQCDIRKKISTLISVLSAITNRGVNVWSAQRDARWISTEDLLNKSIAIFIGKAQDYSHNNSVRKSTKNRPLSIVSCTALCCGGWMAFFHSSEDLLWIGAMTESS